MRSARMAIAFLLASAPSMALAQTIGADSFGYTATQSSGGFEELSGYGPAIGLPGHPLGALVPVGFTFAFYGNQYTNVAVTTQGYLTFTGAVLKTPLPLPSTIPPTAVIAPFWADIDVTQNGVGRIYVKTLGSAPARRFVVEWANVPLAGDPNSRLTFEAVIFEGTNAIEFRYGSLTNGDGTTGGAASGASASIGIDDPSGTVGIQIALLKSGAVQAGERIAFAPGPAPVASVSVRSAVASPGAEVDVPIDVSLAIQGLRGLQGVFEVVPQGTGQSPVTVRSFATQQGLALQDPYATSPDLAATGPVPFVLPVPIPASAPLASVSGPSSLGTIHLVVPSDAVPGSTYLLRLSQLVLVGPGNLALQATTVAGTLTIASTPSAFSLDSLGVSVAPVVTTGMTTQLTVIALGQGAPIPNVPVSIFIGNPSAISVAATSGVTGFDGRFTTTVQGLAPGLSTIVATSAGVDPGTGLIQDSDAVVPAITSTPPTTATVGALYTYLVSGTPAGLTFVLEKAPSGMSINSSGLITWTPTQAQLGSDDVVLRVQNASASQNFSVVVNQGVPATSPNLPPKITSTPPSLALTVGQAFTYDVTATDPDGDSLTWSLQQAPTGMTIDPISGVLTWTPQATQTGESRALILVSDGRGGIDGQGLVLTVSPPAGPLPPIITSKPPTLGTVGTPYTYPVVATSPQNSPLTYSLTTAPAGMTIDPVTGVIQWDPTAAYYNPPPAPLQLSGNTITTLDGKTIPVVAGRWQDPPGLVYGSLLPDNPPSLVGWTPDPAQYGWAGGYGPPGPGGYVQGYGDQRDYLWVQNRAPLIFTNTAAGPVPGGDPRFGLFYDLHGPANKVVVFPTIDHGPLPREALESTVYLSDDKVNWQLATLEIVYQFGWDPNPTHVANGMTGVYSLPGGKTSRYASVVWGGPASINADGDDEIDAVAGLTASGQSVNNPGTPTTVTVVVTDPFGNMATQTYNLNVNGSTNFSLQPTSLDFGKVRIGDQASQYVLVNNTGLVPVNVQAAQAPPPYLADLELSGGEVLVKVTFRPTVAGVATGTVSVVTDNGIGTVSVIGTGVNPGGAVSPAFTSAAPVVAVIGKQFVYSAKATDPAGGGLTYAISSAPSAASIHPTGGIFRWTPSLGQEGVYEVTITATDINGHVATQKFPVVVVKLELFVTATPLESPPGTNTFRVTIRMEVTPNRAIYSVAGPQKLVVIEHVLPTDPGLSIVAGSEVPGAASSAVTPEGTVVGWFAPLQHTEIQFVVQAQNMTTGVAKALSALTRARVLPATTTSVAGAATSVLRTIDTSKFGSLDPRGIFAEVATGQLDVLDRQTGTVFRIDSTGNLLGSDSIAATTRTSEGIDLDQGHYSVVDPNANRMYEFTPGVGGSPTRSTRTDGIALSPRGVTFDARTGTRYLVDFSQSTLVRADHYFGDHEALSPFNALTPRGVSVDPSTGNVWVADQHQNAAIQLDPTGTNLVSSFSLNGVVQRVEGLYFDPMSSHLLVEDLNQQRVFEYTTTGTLVNSTYEGATVVWATGVARDPASGDFFVSDSNAKSIVRLGSQFTNHVPLTPFNALTPRAISRDPKTQDLWIADQHQNAVIELDSTGTNLISSFSLNGVIQRVEGLYFDPTTGHLLVEDLNQQRVFEFTPTGSLVNSTYEGATVVWATGVTRDPASGDFLVSDSNARTIVRLGSQFGNHVPLTPFNALTPRAISRDPKTQDLWIADQHQNAVIELDSTGTNLVSSFSLNGVVQRVEGLYFDPTTGHLLVEDLNQQRVFEFTATGSLVNSTYEGATVVWATGVTRDPASGDFLVSDSNARSVVRLGSQFGNHVPLTPFNALTPRAISRDPKTQDLWIADQHQNAVIELDSTGTNLVSSFSLNGVVQRVEGLYFDPTTGHLLVEDLNQQRVFEFTATGSLVNSTYEGATVVWATGVTRDPASGDFLVSDSNARTIVRLGSQFGNHVPLTPFNALTPRAISRDPKTQDLWIADQHQNAVIELDSTGTNLVSSFSLNGVVQRVEGLYFDPTTGHLLVEDLNQQRVFEFTATGSLVNSTYEGATVVWATGVTRDPASGDFLVSDSNARTVVRLGSQFGNHVPLTPFNALTPRAISRDPKTQNLWIADQHQNAVIQLDSTGTNLVSSFSLNGAVQRVEGLYFDPTTGHLLVQDLNQSRVFEYDASGNLLNSTYEGATVIWPTGITRDPATGDYLVSDSNAKTIVRLGSQFGDHVPLTPFNALTPRGISRDPTTKNLWIADQHTNQAIQLDSTGTTFVSSFFLSGVQDPEGIYFDPTTGNVLVLDRNQLRVFTFTSAGASVSQTALVGFSSPSGLTALNGSWYVTDSGNATVNQVNPATGAITASFSTAGFPGTNPQDVCVASDGVNLAVVDPSAEQVFVVSSTTGALLFQFGTRPFGCYSPKGIVFDGANYRVVDDGERQIFAMAPSGLATRAFSVTGAGSTDPEDVAIAANGTDLVVVDPQQGQVYQFDQQGNSITGQSFSTRTFGCYDPKGIVWDGANYRVVDDGERQIFAMAVGGLPTRPFTVTSAGSSDPEDVAIAANGTDLVVCDPQQGQVYQFTQLGAWVSAQSFSTRTFGSYNPKGIVWDGINYRVVDDGERQIFAMAVGGLPTRPFTVTSAGSSDPEDVAIAANGTDLVVCDPQQGQVFQFDQQGNPIAAQFFSTRTFGCYNPKGIVWDGTNYRVVDDSERQIFAMAVGGLPTRAFTVTSAGSSDPEDVAIASNGADLVVCDPQQGEVYQFTQQGSPVPAQFFSTRTFGCYNPKGIVWDGSNYRVVDDGERQLFAMAVGGLPTRAFTVTSAGSSDPEDVAIAANGTDLVVCDPQQGEVYQFTQQGSPVAAQFFSTRTFGSYNPKGIVWDGSNYRVVDDGERQIFAMAVGGLPVHVFSTTTFGVNDPEDVAVRPSTGTVFVIDGSTHVLAEVTSTGGLVTTYNLLQLGIPSPKGIGIDGASNLRIVDDNEVQLFRLSQSGINMFTYSLGALEITGPEGCAFDPSARTVFVTINKSLYEFCVTDNDLEIVSEIDYGSAGGTTNATDVAVNPTLDEIYVTDAVSHVIDVYGRPDRRDASPGKILYVVEGQDGGLPAALATRGHTLITRPMQQGVLAQNLDATITQVWIVNHNGAGTGPGLSALDLQALSAWESGTGHTGLVLDGTAWQPSDDCSVQAFYEDLSSALEHQGGGVLLAAGPEQPPLANPANGSGTVVASVNQVLDQLGVGRLTGDYTATTTALIPKGDLFTSISSTFPLNPTNIFGPQIEGSAVPSGLQPNGQTLDPFLYGTYASHAPGSADTPQQAITFFSSTSGTIAGDPDATAPGLSITAESILSITPSSELAIQGGTATYVVTIKNVHDTPATYQLSVLGVPADFTTSLQSAVALAAHDQLSLLLGIAVPASPSTASVAFSVHADELLAYGGGITPRDDAHATLTVVGSIEPIPVMLAPVVQTTLETGPVAYVASVTNPGLVDARFTFTLAGVSAVATGAPAIPDQVVPAGATIAVPFAFIPTAPVGDYFISLNVAAPDTPTLVPGVGSTKLTVLTPDAVPIADPGPNQNLVAAGGTTFVQLNGSGSFDPDGAPLTYSWVGPQGTTLVGAKPTVSLPPGTYTYTLTVNDGVQNSVPKSVTITIGNPPPPVVGPKADVFAEQQTPAGTVVTYATPVVSDVTDPNPTVVCSPPSGSTFPLGVTQVVCTATDSSGKTGQTTFSVHVVDTTPPLIGATPNVVFTTTRSDGDYVTYATPSVTDNCDANPTVVCTPASGSFFAIGVTVVTCRATDASGNSSSRSFTVTVQKQTDKTPPVISITAPASGALIGSSTVAVAIAYSDSEPGGTGVNPSTLAVFADGVSVTSSFTATPLTATGSLSFPSGSHTVTAIVADNAGNVSSVASVSFTVDVTKPVITLVSPSQPIVVEQTQASGTPVTLNATATDAFDTVTSLTNDAPAVFPLGTTIVTFTATDQAGNVGTLQVPLTIQDTTPPTISLPQNVVVEQASSSGTVVNYTAPTATDTCDANPVVVCVPPSGSTFPLGVTTVTCTATDASGNKSQATFTVTVQDTTPPTITQPANVVVEQATRAGTVVNFPTPTVTDNCDSSPTVTFSPSSGSTFPLGMTTVTLTATDASGNQSQATFTVTVRDTTPPTITQPANVVVEQATRAGTVVMFPTPTVSDVCDANPSVSFSPASGSMFALGMTTVTLTATDASGNQSQTTFTVTVRDTTPPTITQPASIVVEQATRAGTIVNFPTPTVMDICDANPSVSFSPASGSTFALGVTTVTLTATDASGNGNQATFTVTVRDTTPPTITQPTDITVEQATRAGTVVNFPTPSITDICDANPSYTLSPPSGSTFPLGKNPVTLTAKDGSGNSSQATFYVIVKDTTPPTITQPADMTVEQATRAGTAVNFPTTSITDICDANPSYTFNPSSGSTFPLGKNSVTLTATDASGNSSTVTFSVIVKDTTPPTITQPADMTVEQATRAGTVVTFPTPTITDNCDANPSYAFSPASGSTFPLGKNPVTLTATDASGNSSTATFYVIVKDTTPPLITQPADTTVEQATRAGTVVNFATPTITDICDANPSYTFNPPSGSTFPLGKNPVTLTATDASGNSTSATFYVIVKDTTPPTINQPANVTVQQTTLAGAAVTFPTPTVSDVCDANPTVTFSPASGSTFALGQTTVTLTATDASGNSSSTTFTVTVKSPPPPTIAFTAPASGALIGSSTVVVALAYSASAGVSINPASLAVLADGVSATSSFTATATSATGTLAFSDGTHTVTATIADSFGDVSAVASVSFTTDTAKPVITLVSPSQPIVVEQTQASGTPVALQATVTDPLDAVTSFTNDAPAVFPLGTTIVTFTATDQAGNVGTLQVPVTVRDTTPPRISQPQNVVVEQTSSAGTVVNYMTPTATDTCDANPTVTCSPPSGSTFPLGTTAVVCTATDASGNSSQVTFNVIVKDTTPPTITQPADIPVEQATRAGTAVNFPTPTITDICDTNPSYTFSPPSGSTFPLGKNPVTLTATDASGNSSQATFNVIVKDTTPPTITQPADIPVEQATRAGTVVNFPTPTAFDICDANPSVSFQPPSGSTFPLGKNAVTLTATDASGNASQATFYVIVKDTSPPTITQPADIPVEQATRAGTVVNFPAPTVFDICDANPTVSFQPSSGSTFPLGKNQVTLTAKDTSGNTSQATFYVIVKDTTPPTLTVPAPLTLVRSGPVTASDPAIQAWLATATATDVCDASPTITNDAASFPFGTTAVHFTAKDASGNTATGQSTVTITPTQPMTVTITSPTTGLCTSQNVTVLYTVTGNPTSVTVSGTRTLNGTTSAAGPGPTYTLEGSYVITVTATGPQGSASAQVSFSIDRTPPVVVITSPVAVPHPLLPYPLDMYQLGVALVSSGMCGDRDRHDHQEGDRRKDGADGHGDDHGQGDDRHGDRDQGDKDHGDQDHGDRDQGKTCCSAVVALSPPTDFPIAITYTATDPDGMGVMSTQVLLDGVVLPAGTTSLTPALFVSLNLPVLGRHVLTVKAWDCAGNMGQASVTFEVVLVGRGLLEVKPEAQEGHEGGDDRDHAKGDDRNSGDRGKGDDKGDKHGDDHGDKDSDRGSSGGVVTAFFTLPPIPGLSPLDPSFKDVVTSTLLLTATATGKQAAPTNVAVDAGCDRLVLKFRRADLAAADGTIGSTFVLTGRFFSTTGPAFSASDTIKKSGGDLDQGDKDGGDKDHNEGDDDGKKKPDDQGRQDQGDPGHGDQGGRDK